MRKKTPAKLIQLVIIVVSLGLIIKFSFDIHRLIKAGKRIKLAEQKVSELEKKQKELQEKKDYFLSPEFIEEEARNKLNMARPGETIVILPPNLGDLKKESKREPATQPPNWQRWWNLFF